MKQEVRSYKAGQMIFSKGELSDGLYLVEAGQVEILEDFNGREIAICTLSQGEFLGTITTLLGGGCRTAAARAHTDALLRFFSADTFSKTVSGLPSWARSAIRDVSSRLRHMNNKYLEADSQCRQMSTHFGNPFVHISQIVALLKNMSYLVGSHTVLPLSRVLDQIPVILRLDRVYCTKITDIMGQYGLIGTIKIQSADANYIESEPGILDEFALYLKKLAAAGKTHLLDHEQLEWISSIQAVMQQHQGSLVTRPELGELLKHFNGRVPTQSTFDQMLELGVLLPDPANPAKNLYSMPEKIRLLQFDKAAVEISLLTPKSIVF